MTSNIDLTVVSDDVMSMELDIINFSELDPGEPLSVEMTVYNGDTATVIDSWFNTYYADNRGIITLADLARVWNNYILYRRRLSGEEENNPSLQVGGIKVKIEVTESDDTVSSTFRRVWYSTKNDGMTVPHLNIRLPFVCTDKRTFQDAVEWVYVAGPDQETVTVVASYVSGSTTSAVTFNPTYADYSAFGHRYVLSPSIVALQIPSGARLVSYQVTVGLYSCTYNIDTDHYMQRKQFFYMNRWGAYETLWCVGSEKWNAERTAEFGYSGGELASLDIDVADTYEISTGYVAADVLEQLRDLAQSPSVWVYDNGFKKIVVKDVKIEKVIPSNEARTATITYNYAKRNI